jgi:Mn-dependent DtxR family transcriptional regulator
LTKDELFLIFLYRIVKKKGDLFASIDRYVMGRAIGQNDRGVDNIVRHLAQANFIQKEEGSAVRLTAHGLQLAERLSAEAP